MTEEQDVPGDEEMVDEGSDQASESPPAESPPTEQPASGGDEMATDMGDSDITSDDKLWAAIGYPIAIIAVIVLFMDKKDRPFIKYHAVQAIAFNLVLWVVYAILSTVSVGIVAICFPLFWLVTLWPAYKAYQGEYLELPVITGFLKGQGWTEV